MTPQQIARRLRPIIEQAVISLDDELALQAVELFPLWNGDGYEYSVNDRVAYDDTLYKCLIAHISQSTWMPPDAPSLWVRVDNPAEEWPEWVQPLGGTDAYDLGAKVSHNGKHWISNYTANVWEPGVYGWTEVV